MTGAPTGNVTLVFTDVQGSTTLWEAYEDAMRAALHQHNEAMRALLLKHGGYEVKTEGDAFMLAFSSAQAAVAFCLHAQLALLEIEWPAVLASAEDAATFHGADGRPLWRGLRVRMGAHTGAPHCEVSGVTQRMDYFGPMVNRSARVASAAHGGQIIVSGDVYKQLDLAALQGPVVKDLGAHWLKGLKTQEALYSFVPQALRARVFDAVKSLPGPTAVNETPAMTFDHDPDDHFFAMLSTRNSLDASGKLHVGDAAKPSAPRVQQAAAVPMTLELDESKLAVNRQKAADAAAAQASAGEKKSKAAILAFALGALVLGGAALLGVPRFLGSSSGTKEILHFESSPAGATVTIEGTERGTTPLDLPNDLPDGIYKAVLSKPGYEPATVIFQGARSSTIKGELRKR